MSSLTDESAHPTLLPHSSTILPVPITVKLALPALPLALLALLSVLAPSFKGPFLPLPAFSAPLLPLLLSPPDAPLPPPPTPLPTPSPKPPLRLPPLQNRPVLHRVLLPVKSLALPQSSLPALHRLSQNITSGGALQILEPFWPSWVCSCFQQTWSLQGLATFTKTVI